jgi:hypothetical protein
MRHRRVRLSFFSAICKSELLQDAKMATTSSSCSATSYLNPPPGPNIWLYVPNGIPFPLPTEFPKLKNALRYLANRERSMKCHCGFGPRFGPNANVDIGGTIDSVDRGALGKDILAFFYYLSGDNEHELHYITSDYKYWYTECMAGAISNDHVVAIKKSIYGDDLEGGGISEYMDEKEMSGEWQHSAPLPPPLTSFAGRKLIAGIKRVVAISNPTKYTFRGLVKPKEALAIFALADVRDRDDDTPEVNIVHRYEDDSQILFHMLDGCPIRYASFENGGTSGLKVRGLRTLKKQAYDEATAGLPPNLKNKMKLNADNDEYEWLFGDWD